MHSIRLRCSIDQQKIRLSVETPVFSDLQMVGKTDRMAESKCCSFSAHPFKKSDRFFLLTDEDLALRVNGLFDSRSLDGEADGKRGGPYTAQIYHRNQNSPTGRM